MFGVGAVSTGDGGSFTEAVLVRVLFSGCSFTSGLGVDVLASTWLIDSGTESQPMRPEIEMQAMTSAKYIAFFIHLLFFAP
jgi:hypothetical protein